MIIEPMTVDNKVETGPTELPVKVRVKGFVWFDVKGSLKGLEESRKGDVRGY